VNEVKERDEKASDEVNKLGDGNLDVDVTERRLTGTLPKSWTCVELSGGSHVRGLGLTGSPKPELYFEHSIYDFHDSWSG